VAVLATVLMVPVGTARAQVPPLAISPNVELLTTLPGSAAGMAFSGTHAFVTGWGGVTVLDIAQAAQPQPVGFLPLPHFENEDVDLCGTTLLVVNDREARDIGAVMYVIDIAVPQLPTVRAVLPLGLTGTGRGAGHIANFVTGDCSQAWVDGGDHVEVIDLSNPSAPRSLGKFESEASKSDAFRVTHDTTLDSTGVLWSVGGGGAAGYRLGADPLSPELLYYSGPAGVNPSPYNDFILHNSLRRKSVLLVTEEDYVDTSETPPGGCRGQGKFETWRIGSNGRLTPLDTWETELNGFLAGGGAEDSKAPFTVNCSSHWFDERDGIATVGWYEQGVRFLDVRNPNAIRQVGYYLPADGATWAAYWAPTDPAGEIVYTADVIRGIDVLRIDGGGRAPDTPTHRAPIPDAWRAPTTSSVTFAPSDSFGWSCLIRL
jgi:LVIVD repeat-containing protein